MSLSTRHVGESIQSCLAHLGFDPIRANRLFTEICSPETLLVDGLDEFVNRHLYNLMLRAVTPITHTANQLIKFTSFTSHTLPVAGRKMTQPSTTPVNPGDGKHVQGQRRRNRNQQKPGKNPPKNGGKPGSGPKNGDKSNLKKPFSSDSKIDTVTEEPINGGIVENDVPEVPNGKDKDKDLKYKGPQNRKFRGMGRTTSLGSRSSNTSIRTGVR